MARRKIEPDLEITLSGKGTVDGGLDADGLRVIADLLQGLKMYDPSLAKINVYGYIRKGSAVLRAAVPLETGMMEINPARSALNSFFGEPFDDTLGWVWHKPARTALGKLVSLGRTLGVKVMPAQKEDTPLRRKFAKAEYEQYSRKIAEDPSWRDINGKVLEIDINDRTFELHTSGGVIICKYPEEATDEYILSLAKKVATAHVLCRDKPHRTQWRADVCKSVAPAPAQDLIIDSSAKKFTLSKDELDKKLAGMLVPSEGFLAEYAEYAKGRYGS